MQGAFAGENLMSWSLPFGCALRPIQQGEYCCNTLMLKASTETVLPSYCAIQCLKFQSKNANFQALKGRRDVHFKLPEEPNFSDPDTSASRLSFDFIATSGTSGCKLQIKMLCSLEETPKSEPIFSTLWGVTLSRGAPISSTKVHLLPESRLGLLEMQLSDTFRLCCGFLCNLTYIWYSIILRLTKAPFLDREREPGSCGEGKSISLVTLPSHSNFPAIFLAICQWLINFLKHDSPMIVANWSVTCH